MINGLWETDGDGYIRRKRASGRRKFNFDDDDDDEIDNDEKDGGVADNPGGIGFLLPRGVSSTSTYFASPHASSGVGSMQSNSTLFSSRPLSLFGSKGGLQVGDRSRGRDGSRCKGGYNTPEGQSDSGQSYPQTQDCKQVFKKLCGEFHSVKNDSTPKAETTTNAKTESGKDMQLVVRLSNVVEQNYDEDVAQSKSKKTNGYIVYCKQRRPEV